VRLEVEDVAGRSLTMDGEVLTFVPLRHRTPGREIVYLGQAMTRFTFDGRTTLGLSEYFDAASACDCTYQIIFGREMGNRVSPDIDVLLSKQALHELNAAYCRAIDRADEEALASLVSPGRHDSGWA